MKSIFASKTFWLNLIGMGTLLSNYFPPKYAALALAVLNIINRFLTEESVSITGK